MFLENKNDLAPFIPSLNCFLIKLCLLVFVLLSLILTEQKFQKNIREALKILEWREVVMEEIKQLKKWNFRCNRTTKGKIPVDCKWISIIKYKANGTIEQ